MVIVYIHSRDTVCTFSNVYRFYGHDYREIVMQLYVHYTYLMMVCNT